MKLNKLLLLAAIFAMSAVVMGAFAAHALKATLGAKQLAWVATATEYQMYHSLAAIGVVLLMLHTGKTRRLMWASYSFLGGAALFSGSLYLMALSAQKWLAFITPIGGMTMIVGWVLLISAVYRLKLIDSE